MGLGSSPNVSILCSVNGSIHPVICSYGLMERMSVYGTEDGGSIPLTSTNIPLSFKGRIGDC